MPPKDDGDDHDGAKAIWLMVVQQRDEPAKKPEEDATMKVVAPFIKKCQGEMPATDECSLAKGFDPAKECNTHVEESQKCKSCKAKLLPCVMKAMMKAGIKPPKDEGDDHDGAKAIWLMAVQHPEKPKEDKFPSFEKMLPAIKKCQLEMKHRIDGLCAGIDVAACNKQENEAKKGPGSPAADPFMHPPAPFMGSPTAHFPTFPAGHGTTHHDVGSPSAAATDPFTHPPAPDMGSPTAHVPMFPAGTGSHGTT